MIYEFKIGDWRAVVLSDSNGEGDAARVVTNWTPERLEAEMTALGAPYPKVRFGYNLLAVQTPQGWVMMDGGQGTLIGGEGKLVEALAEAGLRPEDIAHIFISHGHADHYGGLVHPDTGVLIFPNAAYVMSADEWEHWASDKRLNEFKESGSIYYQVITERLLPLKPRLRLIQPGDTVVPGMTAFASPGHTPGHLSLLIEHGGDAVLYIGDLAVDPIHLKYPDGQFYNDVLPEQSPETRRAAIRLAREKHARILACHFEFPGFYDVPDDWPVE